MLSLKAVRAGARRAQGTTKPAAEGAEASGAAAAVVVTRTTIQTLVRAAAVVAPVSVLPTPRSKVALPLLTRTATARLS